MIIESAWNICFSFLDHFHLLSSQGLETALDLLHAGQRGGSLSSALLLTDGVPNVEPPGGHMEALERYKAAKGGAKGGVLWSVEPPLKIYVKHNYAGGLEDDFPLKMQDVLVPS